jgi:hypothetical protein
MTATRKETTDSSKAVSHYYGRNGTSRHMEKALRVVAILKEKPSKRKICNEENADAADKSAVKGSSRIGYDLEASRAFNIVKRLEQYRRAKAQGNRADAHDQRKILQLPSQLRSVGKKAEGKEAYYYS